VSVQYALERIRTLVYEPNASFEVNIKLQNDTKVRAIVTRLDADTYLITLWSGHESISRYIDSTKILKYLESLIENARPKYVWVRDLRR
jgi:hypothetical protein